jgi:hypothetical protein
MVGHVPIGTLLLILYALSPGKVSRLDLYFWSKVRDRDISCLGQMVRTPSRGPSRVFREASIILPQKKHDEVPRAGRRVARGDTTLNRQYTVIEAAAGLTWSLARRRGRINGSACSGWRRVFGG